MNFKPNLWKVIFGLIITFSIFLAFLLISFSLIVPSQEKQTEGVLRSAMINFPDPVIFFYLLIFLVVYYALVYIIWSLFEKPDNKKIGIIQEAGFASKKKSKQRKSKK